MISAHERDSAPRLKKRLCRVFESKKFGGCNAFSHTKLTDQLTRTLALEKRSFNPEAKCLCHFVNFSDLSMHPAKDSLRPVKD